ncbi:dipeptide/oligopeptide/nickel ABC transporter permease/ATP-binding protein [Microbacterium timonense]|uniref:dipeptide/oligopeptide/nickel ABC transporter permease/ATP-binding protein n=1 Tax=Microbacterium timonense TaxID=2086576 RepID=UPI000D1088DA|nr:dipeptide/oligopeptide/nickel ABC transporter permease/ATP-binding protein [Microbacterium timonense]
MTATSNLVVPAPPPRTWTNIARAFGRNRLGMAALIALVAIVLACYLAPVLFPAGPNVVDLKDSLQPPSLEHWLGTDQLGRDLLTRVLYGGQVTLPNALIVTVVAILVAVPLGLTAAHARGWADRSIMFVTDVGLAIPAMVVMLVIMSLFAGYTSLAMIGLGLLLAPPVVRNIRGPALAVSRELYIDAAVVAGVTGTGIVSKHVLPRVMGPILVQCALVSAIALQFAVGLAFLGFGTQPPNPDWGSIIFEGSQVLNLSPWPVIAGGLALGAVTLALVLIGDAVRDVTVDAWAGAPSRRRRSRSEKSRKPVVSVASATVPDASVGSSASLVSVRELTVGFVVDGVARPVVTGVDLDIAPGETVGIVGESGCGKTSVARAIARLLPGGGEILGGTIDFEGTDVVRLAGRELYAYRRDDVSYIAQDPMTALDPTLRVGTLLKRIVRLRDGVSGRQADRRVIELLRQVQLPDPEGAAHRYPHELSGGMAQRVGIARAIATRPRLLIADEPTTALDVTVQAEILTLLQSLQEQYGMAILLVSHDWGVVAEFCDKALVMYAGQVVERGDLVDVVNRPVHPYTAALLACRPSNVTDDSLMLPTIEGSVIAPADWPVGCRFAARCAFRTDACDAAPIPMIRGADGHAARCIHPLPGLEAREPEKEDASA